MWSYSSFYFKSKQAINLRSSSCGRQGSHHSISSKCLFLQLPLETQWAKNFGSVSMQKVMQLNVQSCEIFGSSKQLHYVMMGVQFCGMFKSLGQL